MAYNTPEVEWEQQYFTDYPYAVEVFYGNTCEDIFRTDNLAHAQAKFDKWEYELSVVYNHSVKMFKYNTETDTHDEIDYDGNIIEG